MRLSAQQAQILFQIATDTTNIQSNLGGFTPDQRLKLVNNILNQQSRIIKELDGEDENGDD